MALQKIKSWCAYQERSQQETRQKLGTFGLQADDIEGIIAELIKENFLNEERFAMAFAGGKFRIKQWGKNKIKSGLKNHRISAYCIDKALKSIDEEEYKRTILRIIEKKMRPSAEPDVQRQLFRVMNYLVSRGFEAESVKEYIYTFQQETAK